MEQATCLDCEKGKVSSKDGASTTIDQELRSPHSPETGTSLTYKGAIGFEGQQVAEGLRCRHLPYNFGTYSRRKLLYLNNPTAQALQYNGDLSIMLILLSVVLWTVNVASACTTNLNCSLNGICNTQRRYITILSYGWFVVCNESKPSS